MALTQSMSASSLHTAGLLKNPSKGSLMGQVRGGGRLFRDAPLQGYTEEEMVEEARMRIQDNKSKRRLKQLMRAASSDGMTCATKDLLLAAKLAKMDLPDEMIADTPYATRFDSVGVPTHIHWKSFYGQLQPPPLRGPGGFGQLPPLKKNRPKAAAVEQQAQEAQVIEDRVDDEEVAYWFGVLQNKMKDRFAEVRRAFRKLDVDASGQLDRGEFRSMLNMFNLESCPEKVFDRILELTDFDGDGTISFAEFARLITTSDVNNMKKTLSALGEDGAAAVNMRFKMSQGKNIDKETGTNVKLRRTGPGLEKMRKLHALLLSKLDAEFSLDKEGIKRMFKVIDRDGSGMIRRAELRHFLQRYAKSAPDQVISGLIDYVDTDGDVKTLNYEEFAKMMSKSFLN